LTIDINNPALLYGATVFTTMRVYDRSLEHRLTNWQAHCDRLSNSLQAFAWQLPDWQILRKGAEALLSIFPILRMAIFPDGKEWIIGRYLPEDLAERQQKGIVGYIAQNSQFYRYLPQQKTGNYLGAWLALKEAQKLGVKEAILLDNNGTWLETSTGNLWGYKDNCWWTPSLESGILPGIARAQILKWLQSQNVPVRENKWEPGFVKDLESIAYSNSVVEIIPFADILGLETNCKLNLSHLALKKLRSYFSE
jgi:4-amino-4-deoxychorismate lyase